MFAVSSFFLQYRSQPKLILLELLNLNKTLYFTLQLTDTLKTGVIGPRAVKPVVLDL